MRKVTFGVGNSLDNYIARKDNGVDWLLWGKEVAAVTAAFWKTIDTVIMGRKTYEIAPPGGYRDVALFVLLALVLTLRPNGLFGTAGVADNPALWRGRSES